MRLDRRFFVPYLASLSSMLPKHTQAFQTAKPLPRVTAWMHRNGWSNALQSVENSMHLISEVSPMWYEIKSDATVGPIPSFFAEDPTLLSLLENRQVILRPIITNVSPTGTNTAQVLYTFQNPEKRRVHIENILQIASHPSFHGIDLDYEGIRGAELQYLADFVEELFIHLWAMGKSLSIDIEVQRGDVVLESWNRLGRVADNIRLMVYSEHTERTNPGPIASSKWSRWYLEDAISVIPTHKLTYGMAIYGRLWGERNYSATWQDLMKLGEGLEIERDQDLIPSFRKDNEVAWFEDAQSVEQKILIGQTLGINSFAFWRLGGEDPKIWSMLSGL